MAQALDDIAKRLLDTRAALGLTAADLCRRINCKPNRWSQYEGGTRKITMAVANRLCDEFGVTLDWIYRGNPSALPQSLHAKVRAAA